MNQKLKNELAERFYWTIGDYTHSSRNISIKNSVMDWHGIFGEALNNALDKICQMLSEGKLSMDNLKCFDDTATTIIFNEYIGAEGNALYSLVASDSILDYDNYDNLEKDTRQQSNDNTLDFVELAVDYNIDPTKV